MNKYIRFKKSFFLIIAIIAALAQFMACKKTLEPLNPISDVFGTGKPPGSTAATRYALQIPPIITSTTFNLTAAPGTHNIGNVNTSVWQYNGSMPGPTIIASTGDVINAAYVNNLPEPSIVHWHGMLVSHENDGQPMQVIPQGSTYNYQYPIINRAGLNWYHPHPHLTIGRQVYSGLAGAFVIRDEEEANLELPAGNHEVPLILRDLTLDKQGNPVYNPTGGGYFGKIPLVNGTRDPYLVVDKTVYRFRILSGATSRVFKLVLSNGQPFTLIGNDGGLLPFSSSQGILEASPGERLDVLVDFSSYAPGTKIMLRDLNAGWDLLEFRVNSTTVPYTGALATSSTIPALSNPDTTRFFSFDGMGRINGMLYDMNRIDFEVPFGRTELWTFKTNGNGPHPVHVHGASFQVVSRTGGRGEVFPWEAGWKDVVLVNDFETVNVLIRFDAYKGIYVMHCHKLEHEDNGMMMNFRVK